MNRKSLLSLATLSIALIGTGAAFAQEATSDAWTQIATSKSRVQVNAELQQARANGSILAGEQGYIEPFSPTVSRAQVRFELTNARVNGQLDAINAQAQAFAPLRMVDVPTVLASK
jgi:hypothetical protein